MYTETLIKEIKDLNKQRHIYIQRLEDSTYLKILKKYKLNIISIKILASFFYRYKQDCSKMYIRKDKGTRIPKQLFIYLAMSCGMCCLSSAQPGVKPMPQSLNHWPTREAPTSFKKKKVKESVCPILRHYIATVIKTVVLAE